MPQIFKLLGILFQEIPKFVTFFNKFFTKDFTALLEIGYNPHSNCVIICPFTRTLDE